MKKKNVSLLFRFLFVIALICGCAIAFRGSVRPVCEKLLATPPYIVVVISITALGYFVMEGLNLWILAKKYNPLFTVKQGIACAFYACFYRTATLGSGSSIAAMYYLSRHNVPVGSCVGLVAVQYASYKIAIALYSGICLLLHFNYFSHIYADYMTYIMSGYAAAFLIAFVMMVFCAWDKLHILIVNLLRTLDKKKRYTEKTDSLERGFASLSTSTKYLLSHRLTIFKLIFSNMIRLTFWYAIPCILFRAVSISSISRTIGISALSTALAAVIPTPAGIGSTEFVFTLLFSAVNQQPIETASSMLLYRFATFIFPFLVGSFVAIAVHIHNKTAPGR